MGLREKFEIDFDMLSGLSRARKRLRGELTPEEERELRKRMRSQPRAVKVKEPVSERDFLPVTKKFIEILERDYGELKPAQRYDIDKIARRVYNDRLRAHKGDTDAATDDTMSNLLDNARVKEIVGLQTRADELLFDVEDYALDLIFNERELSGFTKDELLSIEDAIRDKVHIMIKSKITTLLRSFDYETTERLAKEYAVQTFVEDESVIEDIFVKVFPDLKASVDLTRAERNKSSKQKSKSPANEKPIELTTSESRAESVTSIMDAMDYMPGDWELASMNSRSSGTNLFRAGSYLKSELPVEPDALPVIATLVVVNEDNEFEIPESGRLSSELCTSGEDPRDIAESLNPRGCGELFHACDVDTGYSKVSVYFVRAGQTYARLKEFCTLEQAIERLGDATDVEALKRLDASI